MQRMQANADGSHVNYMWVNVTCHVSIALTTLKNYLLASFDLQPMFIPTVVFYHPLQ
jgi:hypothetical protein